MFIRKAQFNALVEALHYAKTQLEDVDSKLTYWDESGINKSVTQMAIKKANEALKQVK